MRLAQHPDQRARLIVDPMTIPRAIDEMVHFDSPIPGNARTLTRDIDRHGQKLPAGDKVLLLYAAANRDDREFTDPDVFDINRKPARIASFGAGQHACLGTHVARFEGRPCLEALLRAAPKYEVDLAGARRFNTEFVQGYESLPVRF